MYLDFVLAAAHHIAIFALAAGLVAEFVLTRSGPFGADAIRRLARADALYGASAVAIVLIGIGRVIFGLKGWEYYVGNHAFWGKMAVFAIVGAVSSLPTLRIGRWRRQLAAEPGFIVPADEAARTAKLVKLQCVLFLLIPVFAAAMARGIGA